MISVDEARTRILASVAPLAPVELALADAFGLALAADLASPVDLPPFTNSAMDGFAVRSEETTSASADQPVRLTVVARLLAGDAVALAPGPASAVRIMTGAPVPDGFDAVIPFEEAETDKTGVLIIRNPVSKRRNVRPRGEDLRAGDPLAVKGESLTPARIGLLAAAGITQPRVHPAPRVAILSTGDELLPAGGAPLEPARIHDSNGPMLEALVRSAGGVSTGITRIGDDPAALRSRLSDIGEIDLLISSGGISAGDSDHLRDLMTDLGRLDFWQVAIKPGKPLAFGRTGAIPWIALPGNPVAAAVAFWQFARPAIRTLAGHRTIDLPEVPVRVTERIENRGGRRAFVRANVAFTPDGALATPIGKGGSAMLGSLAQANALIVVPEHIELVAPGDPLTAQLID